MKKNYPFKKNLLLTVFSIIFVVFFNYSELSAQVGIGTSNPDPSAVLHIQSTNKGVLLPKVDLQNLTDRNTVNEPTEGLLVYNKHKSDEKHLNNSFYIWDGEKWDQIQSQRDADKINKRIDSLKTSIGNGSGDSWSIEGNNLGWNGTSNKFLGSTTYAELNFRVNDSLIAKFHPNGGVSIGKKSKIDNAQRSFALGQEADASGNQDAFAIGTKSKANTNRSVALGFNSETNQTNAFAIGVNSKADGTSSYAIGNDSHATSTDAFAVGTGAVSSASASIAIGQNSKSSNVYASAFGVGSIASNQFSLAIGNQANSAGMHAMAIGNNSKASGSNSIASGYKALSEATNSIAIGTEAKATLQYSIAIGYGAQTKKEHTVVIGNAGYESNGTKNEWYKSKVGIGTYDPRATLDVKGSFKLVDGSEGANKVLTSDANGNASWKDSSVNSSGKKFKAAFNLGTISANGGSNIIEVNIPENVQPSSTHAIITITPENNLNDDIYIAWSKMKNKNSIRIKLVNTGGNIIYNDWNEFYISINEI